MPPRTDRPRQSRSSIKPEKTAPRPAAITVDDDADTIVASLRRLGSTRVRDEMSTRYGIHLPDPQMAFGVGMAAMQKVAKEYAGKDARRNHALAAALWETGWYEARMVASLVDDPSLVTAAQMDRWCADFDNWGICDTVCFKLFDRVDTVLAFRKIEKWTKSEKEFVRRAGFALLACVALHNKDAADDEFAARLPLIERAAPDDRNFVKKGVSWALRAIGGRSAGLNSAATGLARRLAASNEPSARWIGRDALKSLKNPPKK